MPNYRWFRLEECADCNQARSLHPGEGPCRAMGCRCPGWIEPPDVPGAPETVAESLAALRPSQAQVRARKASGPVAASRPRLQAHRSDMFGSGAHASVGLCSHVRYCGNTAVYDAFDAAGRRRALCRDHRRRSVVFGPGSPRLESVARSGRNVPGVDGSPSSTYTDRSEGEIASRSCNVVPAR